MEWLVTTARTVEEAQTKALDLLGVAADDAEIQVIEEGKTGLFGRTKTEARIRARIKPKAPPEKDDRRQGRGDRNRNRNRNRRGSNNRGGGQNKRENQRSKSGGNRGGNQKSGAGSDGQSGGKDGANQGQQSQRAKSGRAKADSGRSGGEGAKAVAATGGGNRNRNRNRNRQRDDNATDDRVEMPVDEQRETLEAFVVGVAQVFDSGATVTMVEEGTTLVAKVNGEDLGRLIGARAATLQTFEELARTAMHRAAAGRRYHRIHVDVDDYRARRSEALARFATGVAESVAESGESKAMEPMSAADRKLVHDAVSEVAGVETVSEGRDPRRYIVILPLDGADEEE